MTPYQKIMRAAKRGTGIRLSFDEVWQLSRDEAISAAAAYDDIADGTTPVVPAEPDPKRTVIR